MAAYERRAESNDSLFGHKYSYEEFCKTAGRPGITDVHSHILPGVDDGAATEEEAVGALMEAEKQGVTKMILTPHYYPESGYGGQEILNGIRLLKKQAEERGIGIELYPGQECLYHSELPGKLERGEVLTLAGSRYVLVEFLENVRWWDLRDGLKKLKEHGFIPILAHYERYSCLQKQGKVQELKKDGVLLQLNYDTVQRVYGPFRRNPFHADLKKGYVDFLGSDCHGLTFRQYYIWPSVLWLERHLPEEVRTRILCENPRKILDHVY